MANGKQATVAIVARCDERKYPRADRHIRTCEMKPTVPKKETESEQIKRAADENWAATETLLHRLLHGADKPLTIKLETR